LVVVVVIVVLMMGLPPAPVRVAQAASLTVNTLSDADDGMDGQCSLREAIIAANNNANYNECTGAGFGNDTITFSVSGTIDLNNGTLDILPSGTLTINGSNRITISGVDLYRIFFVCFSATLNLQNLTVTRANEEFGSGGGLFNDGGTVTITGSTFSNNTAFVGGGLNNGCVGMVTITNSTFTGNSADTGGGIENGCGGTVTIMSSTFSGNSALFGGGLENFSGTVTITNSTFSNNPADNGGAINNFDMVTIMSSTLSGNSASSFGGGIFNSGGGTVAITNSTLTGNSASVFGGGIRNSGGGTVTTMSSTLSGNSATSGGGGIHNSGSITITSSTLSGNSTGFAGGGIINGGTVNIKNSIVANSPSGGNCSNAATFTASGVNFDTDGSCSGFMLKTSAELNLGPLQLNAPGTTRTHALLSGSVAINAVTDCTDLAMNPVTTDQRGVMRPQGVGCDVGAFEALVQSPTFFTLQGTGVCLTLNLRTRQYILRTPRQTIAGIFSFRQSGQVIRIQSAYGDTNRLLGWINLTTGRASAVLSLPLGLGGQRFTISDANIADNAPCL
jgi:CSLREA domain-containing protein